MSVVTRVWRQTPGEYFFLATKRNDKLREHCFTRDQFYEVDDFIREHDDRNIYFCPHGFNEPKRRKEHAAIPKLLWADLDEIDPRELQFQPSIAWESSPGRYAAIWKLDRPMQESLNKAMTYAIGADKGGWDLSQLLRIPGSTNYKYDKPVKGRLMWGNGPTHEMKFLEKALQPDSGVGAKKGLALDPVEVYKKYETKMSPQTRRDLRAEQAHLGKRSEVLWRLWNDLFDAGCRIDEAKVLVQASVWNKFRGRSSEEEQLAREGQKILQERLDRPTTAAKTDDDIARRMKRLSDVEETNVNWLIPGWFARGAMTIVEGDPGIGKSYWVQVAAIHVVDGRKFPCTRGYRTDPLPGTVLYFDVENDISSVTKPRIVDNGCKRLEEFIQSAEILALDQEEDLDILDRMFDLAKPDLVVFDTINTYMGQGDTHKASDVQQTLSNLVVLAEKHNFALVLVRHLTKGGKDKIQYRGQGSIAFMGMARIVHTVAEHPNEDGLIIKTTKMNFGKRERGLRFHIEDLPPRAGRDERSILVLDEFDDTVSDFDLNAPKKDKKEGKSQKEDIEAFLVRELTDKKVERHKIIAMAEARGMSERNVERCARELEVQKVVRGKTAIWSL